jgi:hypothetical protein
MSDLGSFVAAALRDKVVQDLLEENRNLVQENSRLVENLCQLLQLTLRSSNNRNVVYTRITHRGEVEHVQAIPSLQELLEAQVWIGPCWYYIDHVARLAVDSVLYSHIVAEGENNNDFDDIDNMHQTGIQIDTRWLSFHMVVPQQLLEPGIIQSVAIGTGHETVQDVLQNVTEPVGRIEILSQAFRVPFGASFRYSII